MGLHPLSHGYVKDACPSFHFRSVPMTNGADKHHGPAAKKKAAKKPKVKGGPAALKRKNLLPAGLNAEKKG